MAKIMGTTQRMEKIKKLMIIYYILEPIFFIAGIVLAVILRGNWYALGLLALGVCYVSIGYKISNLIDDYVKFLYPQCYSLKERPKNSQIKAEAKKQNDQLTVNLKHHQTIMFVVCAVLIILLCMIGLVLS